jgi:hypothetical protein
LGKLQLALASMVNLGFRSRWVYGGKGQLQSQCLPKSPPAESENDQYQSEEVVPFQNRTVGQSVKLLLAFTSTVIPGFSLLKVHDQDLYALLEVYMFQNGASPSTKKGRSFYVGTMFVVL